MKRDSSAVSPHLSGEQSLVVGMRRPEGVELDSFFGPVRVERQQPQRRRDCACRQHLHRDDYRYSLMRFAIALLIALAGAVPARTATQNFGVTVANQPVTAACPYPSALSYPPGGVITADPCLTAPAPTTAYWRQPNAFAAGGYINTVAGTTTDYSTKRPQYNVPGVDYAIGPYTPFAQLKDPAIAGAAPGCVYTATSFSPGSGLLTCGGTNSGFNGTVAHINFGPIGGHSCTALAFRGTPGVTTFTVDDFYFFNNDGACVGNSTWTGMSGTIAFTNCFMDGNAENYRTSGGGHNVLSSFNISGNNGLTIKYCVLQHFAGRMISMPWGTTSDITITGSWIEGWDYSILNGHTEWWLAAGTNRYNDLDHTVMIQDMPVSNFGPAPLFPAFVGGAQIDSFVIDADLMIDSSVGGGDYLSTVSGCIGATFANGVCSGAGPYFFVTAQRGKIGSGQTLICGGPFIQIVDNLGSGNGYLAQWTYDGTTYAPTGTLGPVSCRNVRMRNHIAGNAGFAHITGITFNHFQVTNLYGDFASTQPWISGSSTCTTPAVFGGNTDMSGVIRNTLMNQWNPRSCR
jgi:hypothetical protein